ncbi:hypothetical protein FP2506_02839 [Fulvimarina pelagi HTCC2506]|uniref:Uncharacterized protein n=1 Tax=Fulvimarina pelagi HTCC2506 TaxID=314231 RepID=Q0G0G5_9HYPH|nr:hypothetical protein FP2506_02839 [Fulvimarina pelagi HTCC2506]
MNRTGPLHFEEKFEAENAAEFLRKA